MYIPTNPQFDVKNSSTTAVASKRRIASNNSSNATTSARMAGITKNHQNNHHQHHPHAHQHHHWSNICTEFFRVIVSKKKPFSTVNNNNSNQQTQQNYNNNNGTNNDLCLEQLSEFQKNYVSFPDFDTYEANTSNVSSTILTTTPTDRAVTKANGTKAAAVVITSPTCGQNHSITHPRSNYWELTSHC